MLQLVNIIQKNPPNGKPGHSPQAVAAVDEPLEEKCRSALAEDLGIVKKQLHTFKRKATPAGVGCFSKRMRVMF
jgi:hypothetical protein